MPLPLPQLLDYCQYCTSAMSVQYKYLAWALIAHSYAPPPPLMQVFYESSTSDINDPDYYSPASDIWSFGGVCLHLAMGFCCPRMQYQVREGRMGSQGGASQG